MDINLDNWKKDWSLISRFFKPNEIAKISGKLKKLKIRNVVYCSFENRFARSGGLAAVTVNTLPYLKEINNIPNVILMTPFYSEIIDKSKLRSSGLFFSVPFNGKDTEVELYEYDLNYTKPVTGTLKEYYLKAEGFFDSGPDPYVYHKGSGPDNDSAMRENVLFFCKAVPLALSALNIKDNIIFHLQEWQTSLISLTSKDAMLNGTLDSCGTVQTMHNSYDAYIPVAQLKTAVSDGLRQRISFLPGSNLTAYQIALQLVDAPATTVSENFAKELSTDLIQTGYFAPHLQSIFRKSNVIGINNGMFVGIAQGYTEKDPAAEAVRKIKLQKRKALLKVLSSYKPKERFGELTWKGKTILSLPDNIPILVMSGRLDPLQKGYDVLLRALEKFAEDEVKAVLTPMTSRSADLDYFYEVACKCKGNLTIFPGRMEQGYQELQQGATFGVMPSLYEPFGAAVEYMAGGTVNIGRATGGLTDQIDAGCGFLYKEDAVFYTLDNIRAFAESGNIVQMRKANPWMQNMSDNLYDVLKKAAYVYQYKPDEYYKLIINGLLKVRDFSWETNARKYYQVYEQVARI